MFRWYRNAFWATKMGNEQSRWVVKMVGQGPHANLWVKMELKKRKVRERETLARSVWHQTGDEIDDSAPNARCGRSSSMGRTGSATLRATA